MQIRWLGWAGMEIEADGVRLVIDPLQDAGAVFAFLGERAAAIEAPEVVAAQGDAVAGLVTHLHRDHADAAALAAALAPGAPVLEPPTWGGGYLEQAAVAQADAELSASHLERRPLDPWATVEAGPFAITAIPAADGTGDPQVSWLVEAGGRRVLHLGDTLFHGWWWRIAERFGAPHVVCAPINGARLTFPHRQPPSPLPGVMDPEQAALAADLLRAETVVPMHYGAYAAPGLYEPVADPLVRLRAACDRVRVVELGATLAV
jgi:L-ascorbate metabolism protein UlaG (beta-lactamase superfamily)